MNKQLTIPTATPFAFSFNPAHTALVVIDMQRDFVEPGGFGASLGNDVTRLQAIIPAVRARPDVGVSYRPLPSPKSYGHCLPAGQRTPSSPVSSYGSPSSRRAFPSSPPGLYVRS